ncbi:Protein RTM1 [Talaromyces islandicus]|uniref:Protein RTM1 n=1 Tax=Talaromyces islandicus TaxID=28573 RepID=A0A0U1LVX4_TALIS|nr:Protein RTM1 [Talaromyces islandicus]
MDIVYHNGTNGSHPWVEFYPYTPSASAGYAFMGLFGVATVAHFILIFLFRAPYFLPMIVGGETFGYYGRAWSHQSRTEIKSWALAEMLIMTAPPLLAATIYMVLGRIIRSFDAEHLSRIRVKRLTRTFVLNDVICFCTQLGGIGVQVTGDANIMNIGNKVVLAGLIFSLFIFALFVWIAFDFHRRLSREPTKLLLINSEQSLPWKRYMLVLYISSLAMIIRNLVRTIQFGASRLSPINTQEAYIYVFDASLLFISVGVLLVYHPGKLIKKARRLASVNQLHGSLVASEVGENAANYGHIPLTDTR